MKGIHAARAAGVEKCQSCRSRHGKPIAIGRHIGHVVSDESIGASQNLLFVSRAIKSNQAVGGGNVHRARLRIQKDAVDAEHMLVFHMGCASVVAVQDIEAAIKVADPEATGCVGGQR